MRTKGYFLKSLLITSVLLWGFSSYGQSSSLIPPPPEAASFFKSTDIPVSMYTGLPGIGVDFYTIKTKELQLPIRLNYNARGIQVAEVASRTGIGWALQYGGMISRQIRGSADEMPFGILHNTYYNRVFKDLSVRNSLNASIVNDNIDEFPDQFYFDINGENGKFILDHNDDGVVLQKFDDLKIVPLITTEEGIVSWTATDNLGNKYYYGRSKDGARQANDYDWSNHRFSFSNLNGMTQLGSNEDRANAVWHLMEIETYLHERIEFIYEEEEGIQYRRSYDKVEGTSRREVKSYFSRVHSIQYQIKEIRFPGGRVLFEKDVTKRKDYTNTYALKKILIKDAQDNQITAFAFDYFNQRCQDDNNQLAYLKQIDTAANYRLFLSGIKETNNAGVSLPSHQFEYSDVKLPNRFSTSQDNWGYYNRKNNGQYLTFFTYSTPVNRQVDTIFSSAGLLNKMTYPTGGSTTFTYEQNRVMPHPYVNSLLTNPNNPIDTVSIGVGLFKDSAFYANDMYSKEVTIGKDIMPNSMVRFTFVQPMETDPSIINYQVVLKRLDSATTIYLYPPHSERQLNLAPGQYRLMILPTRNITPAFMASLQWKIITKKNPHQLEEGEWYGAGKRIKKIEHRNPDDLVTIKEYQYLNNNGTTSGKMFGLPNFYYIQRMGPGSGVPFVDQYGSLPGSPLAQLQGNSVGYQRVTEYYGSNSINQGKTVYEFTVDEDGGDYYKFPYHLPNDMEWLRGKPLSTKIYKNNAGSYELQKSIQNTYLYAGSSNWPHLLMQPFIHMDSGYVYRKDRNLYYLPLLIFTNSDDPNGFKVYHLSGGTVDLDSTIEKEYVNGSELVKTTKYGYNYQKHYQQVVQKNRTSKGNGSIATTYYPLDLSVRTAAEQKLVDLHRLVVPVSIEIAVKNSSSSTLSKTVNNTVYKDWGNNLVLPEKVQSSINNAPFVNEITYHSYNNIGSPLEISPKTGVKEAYVWGYNNHYPVAKVSGSNYNTVISFVNQGLLENAAHYSEAAIRTELNKIRTGLASTIAEVFTYTYKPMVGIMSVTDSRNQTIYYEYDGFNRLSLIRDEARNILKKLCYNYQGQQEECGVFSSTKSGTYTKQCSDGGAGTIHTYTVTKTSSLSQADADNKALTDVAANGQVYANATGSCTWDSDIHSVMFTKQCADGGSGTSHTYTIQAGAYTSIISKADANQKAQVQLNNNGQAYANNLGSCTWYSDNKSGNYYKQNCPQNYSANPYYVNIGAGAYSSAISKADADQKAISYAQNLANQNGTCTWVCSTSNCNSKGPAYKCINGQCEWGIKVFTSSYYDPSTRKTVCVYHYEWSDGSWSQDYTQYLLGGFTCNVGSGPLG